MPVLLLQAHGISAAEFALPYLRFGIMVIAPFLVARLLLGVRPHSSLGPGLPEPISDPASMPFGMASRSSTPHVESR